MYVVSVWKLSNSDSCSDHRLAAHPSICELFILLSSWETLSHRQLLKICGQVGQFQPNKTQSIHGLKKKQVGSIEGTRPWPRKEIYKKVKRYLQENF